MVLANTAFAHGGAYGGSMGFGFVFLNFVGHVLFLLLIFWLIKNFVFAMRGESGSGWGPSSGSWASSKWKARHQDGQNAQGMTQPKVDTATTTARQRLADGEITPEEFGVIQQGLSSQVTQANASNDSALETARMRFAKSEITAEEFEAVKKALLGTSDQV